MYNYFVNSKCEETDSIFDDNSLKAYKSLKAYRYSSDGLVRNFWAHSVEETEMMIIRAYYFSSLKAKTTYTAFVAFQHNGDVVYAECKCVAEKGGACSHVAALLFYLEDLKRNNVTTLPADPTANATVTDKLQQWHVPPKRGVTPLPLSQMALQKSAYGKPPVATLKRSISAVAKPHQISIDEQPLKKFVADITETFPECGLSHFWKGDSHKEDCNDITDTETLDTDISVGLARLSRKLVIFDGINTSLAVLANELSDIDTEGEYFKDLCHDYVCEQVIDKELSDFIERNTRASATVHCGKSCITAV